MASGYNYTPASPEKFGPKVKSQLPDDSDEEDMITTVCPDSTGESIKTFIIKKQGHTLGNVLRDVILQNPDVHFCAFSIPHAGENVLHLRIQTRPGAPVSANDVLKKALKDVIEICEIIEEKYTAALESDKYEAT